MSSPFSKKFHSKSPISPIDKALVGKQNRLPQHLQDAIQAAPEMKDDSPLDKHGDKFRKEAMKLSEGVEQGDYDYENPKVNELIKKATEAEKVHATLDARSKKDGAKLQAKKKQPAVNYNSPLDFDIYGEDAEFAGGDFYVSNAADFQKLQDNIVSATKDAMSNKKIKGEYQLKRAERRKKRKGEDEKQQAIKARGEANVAQKGNKKCTYSGEIIQSLASDGTLTTITCP